MYLNEKELDDIPEDTGLTLTWDVFKLDNPIEEIQEEKV